MNIKKLQFIILFLFLPILSIAQDHNCGTHQPNFTGKNMNKFQLHQIQELELFTQKWIAKNKNKGINALDTVI